MVDNNSEYLIQLIHSSIELLNGNIIYNQELVLDAFLSDVTVNSITIRESTFVGNAFQITNSNLSFKNAYLYDLITTGGTEMAIIYASLESYVVIDTVLEED